MRRKSVLSQEHNATGLAAPIATMLERGSLRVLLDRIFETRFRPLCIPPPSLCLYCFSAQAAHVGFHSVTRCTRGLVAQGAARLGRCGTLSFQLNMHCRRVMALLIHRQKGPLSAACFLQIRCVSVAGVQNHVLTGRALERLHWSEVRR
jgi:hypothetical protein